MRGYAKCHALYGLPVPTAPATAWSVCGAAAPSAAWTPTLTSSLSPTGSVWSGRPPPALVSVCLE